MVCSHCYLAIYVYERSTCTYVHVQCNFNMHVLHDHRVLMSAPKSLTKILNKSSLIGKALGLLLQTELFEHPYESLDTKYKVCGGTREALAIRRTLLDRQCSRTCGIVSIIWSHQTPPPRRAPTPQTLLQHPVPGSGASIERLLLGTFVITACYSDLRPGSEF